MKAIKYRNPRRLAKRAYQEMGDDLRERFVNVL
jgi:hypothetical protein